jgi:2,3-bisphosphoglycerate-dependent phosphoglycerate mutase
MANVIAALLRHGEYHQLANTPSAHQPFPLTDAGREQAAKAAAAISREADRNGWALSPVIDASNLLRGWETAQLLGSALSELHGRPFTVRGFDALAERGLGCASNLTIGQIEAVVRADPRCSALPDDWKSNSRFRLPLPGAESLLEAGSRVAGHLEKRVRELAAGADVDMVKIFVGHGAAFRHAAHVLGVLEFDDIARLSMFHARPVFLRAGDRTPWQRVAGEWKHRKKAGQRGEELD